MPLQQHRQTAFHSLGRIRPARRSDAASIAEAHVQAWQTAFVDIVPGDYLDQIHTGPCEAQWRERIAAGEPHTLVCEGPDGVLGFVHYGRWHGDATGDPTRPSDSPLQPADGGGPLPVADPPVGMIHALYLHPSAWGRGIGRGLCEAAFDAFRRWGFGEVKLWVLRDNVRAIGFYRHMGFAFDGREKVVSATPTVLLPERGLCRRL